MSKLKNYPVRRQFINRTKGQSIKLALAIKHLFFVPALFLQLINYSKEQDNSANRNLLSLSEASELLWGYHAAQKSN